MAISKNKEKDNVNSSIKPKLDNTAPLTRLYIKLEDGTYEDIRYISLKYIHNLIEAINNGNEAVVLLNEIGKTYIDTAKEGIRLAKEKGSFDLKEFQQVTASISEFLLIQKDVVKQADGSPEIIGKLKDLEQTTLRDVIEIRKLNANKAKFYREDPPNLRT